MVVGDGDGQVGLGYGKAREVPLAIQKGTEDAKKNLFEVPAGGHDHHPPVLGVYGAARVLLKPAAPGTGVIAGGAARVILEEAGVHDVLCKSLGSSNHINVARATVAGLKGLRRPDDVARIRGKSPEEVTPPGLLRAYRETTRGPTPEPTEVAAWPMLKVTQVRSAIGTKPKHRGTLRALGLGRIGRRTCCPTDPRSGACCAGSRTS